MGRGVVLFADRRAEIREGSVRGAGLFAWDTRHLSRYRVRPEGATLRLRGAEVRPDGVLMRYELREGGVAAPIEIVRHVSVDGELRDRWSVINRGSRPRSLVLRIEAAADFRDLFEVRRERRVTTGRLERPRTHARAVRFAYTATDGVRQTTELRAPIRGWRVIGRIARGRWTRRLRPEERHELTVVARPSATGLRRIPGSYEWEEWRGGATRFASDDADLAQWLEQSGLDLFLLSQRLDGGPFPVAGIPWFATTFGRDSLLTAMFALPYRRDLALGVLRQLARLQGRADVPQRDEEPGRIAHEVRQGEIVRTGGAFGSPYYGSVDATPLFVWLAAETARWLPGSRVIEELAPALRAALRWMDERGDIDGDGFIEYRRRAPQGIENQVWKDSHDSLLDAEGRRPDGPIAAVEVQAYAYAAWRGLAAAVRDIDRRWCEELTERAGRMRATFERAFWCAERDFYAQAMDGAKRQIADITSNPGHVLWARIASREHGAATAKRLRYADLASGWGIRTRSARSRHFQPGSYHNGSVWPHDTAIAAAGMRAYGARSEAAATIGELLDAARAFPARRLPELFGGERRDAPAPVPYPVACSPQAWTAAAAFLCVRTMLGLEVSADGRVVTLDPVLPPSVDRFEASGMAVGSGSLDVRIARRNGRAVVAGVLASGIDVRIRSPQRVVVE